MHSVKLILFYFQQTFIGNVHQNFDIIKLNKKATLLCSFPVQVCIMARSALGGVLQSQ
jgi:hypothetical protein